MADSTDLSGGAPGQMVAVARLKPGVTLREAKADLAAVAAYLTTLYHAQTAPFAFDLLRAFQPVPKPIQDAQKAMLGAALAVLLIACANLATLMLARGLAKRRELALRLAIGAGRRAIVGQMFAEAALLTTAGAALGALLSLWGGSLLTHEVPSQVWWLGTLRPQLSWRVFALTLGAAAAAAILFGLIPAVRVARAVSLDEPLKDGAGTTAQTRNRYSRLVIGEVALALVLLMGAGLLLRVVRRLETYDFHFPARQLLSAVAGSYQGAQEAAGEEVRVRDAIVTSVRQIPGVVDVAVEGDPGLPGDAVTAELTSDSTRMVGGAVAVTPNFLRTIGLRVVQGRDFMEGDATGDGVAIVNAAAAARLYPRQSAVGRMIKLGGPATSAPWVRIVGVCRTVTDAHLSDLANPGEPAVYLARPPTPSPLVTLAVRVAPRSRDVAVRIERVIRETAPDWFELVEPYVSWYDRDLFSRTFLARLFATLGAFALLLAAVGIYGVVAYAVSVRTREFAVRMALGAERLDVFKTVFHDGLVMTLAGTGLGAFAALWASGLLGNLLEDVPPTDPVSLVAAEAALLGATVLACLVPALRAMRADPIEILRAT